MDPAKFFGEIRTHLFAGTMSNAQVDGCNTILATWAKYRPQGDPRAIGYSLATPYWETGRTMQPVREVGRGQGRAYGHPTGPWHLVYYGRGDVQDTWEANYAKATLRLREAGVINHDEDLVHDPDLMLRPDIAAATLVLGMDEGWFTGRRLGQYFDHTRSDWVDARAIINGHDHAALIAGFALHFYHGLTA